MQTLLLTALMDAQAQLGLKARQILPAVAAASCLLTVQVLAIGAKGQIPTLSHLVGCPRFAG